MQYREELVTADQLLLDPNNYRFHDLRDYKAVKQKVRYEEEGVQERALALLRDTDAFDLGSLRDSIRTNGYIPVEKIVVVPYEQPEGQPEKYLVIEGNRRASALKTLLADAKAGAIDLPELVADSIARVPVVVLAVVSKQVVQSLEG